MRHPRVAFRADASRAIGGGHVMRCLSVAERLSSRGCEVAFLVNPEAAATVERLGQAPVTVLKVATEDSSGVGALARHWPAGADIAVVDHYGLTAEHERQLRGKARRIAVIDDLADRLHDCDLLVDTSAARTPAAYAGRVPPNCKLLLGPAHAMLRDEFVWARPLALERRDGRRPREVLVSMGLTDVGAITAQIAETWVEACPDVAISCIVGPEAASLPRLERLKSAGAKVLVHISPESVAALMAEADYAIGAAGTTAWERCCLGLPATVVTVARNQFENADALFAGGAAIAHKQVPPDPRLIVESTLSLFGKGVELRRMAAAASAICDGSGVTLICDTLAALIGAPANEPDDAIQLRPAARQDALPIWCWRNDQAAREASLDSNYISWTVHQQWFARALASGRRHMFMGSNGGRLCGCVRFDELDEKGNYRVSISLDPAMRGKGIGKRLLAMAITQFRRPPARLVAEIRASNTASLKTFTSCQFDIDSRIDEVFHLSRWLRD